MNHLMMVSIIALASASASAGPFLRALNSQGKIPAEAGLGSLGKDRLNDWAEFAVRVSQAKEGRSFGDMSSRRMGLVFKDGDRTVIHALERTSSGDLRRTEFAIPPSTLPASSIEIRDTMSGIQLSRRFETASGEVAIDQSYFTSKLEKTQMRLQEDFSVAGPQLRGKMQRTNDSILIETFPKEGKKASIEFSKQKFDGTVVAFNLKSDGSRATFHIKKGDEYTEEVYSLTRADADQGGAQTLKENKFSFRTLTAEEVKRFGLLAEEKVIAKRTTSAKTAGGMQIEGSVGVTNTKSNGMN